MIAKQDLNFVYNQLKGRGFDWNWVTGLSLCHKTLKTLFFVRDCMKAPGAPSLISEWPRSQGSRGLGYLFSPESDVSSTRAKWCNFNLIFNGAVSLRFLKTKLLFHSHIAFTEDNYSPSAILASLLHSLHCIKWKSEIGIEINWIKFPFWPLDFLWLYWQGRWFLFIIYQFLFKFLHTLRWPEPVWSPLLTPVWLSSQHLMAAACKYWAYVYMSSVITFHLET